jgi:phage tail sheath protein FI
MALVFHHGITIEEAPLLIRPVQTVRSAVIGLIGTAPDANATTFPLDTPVMVPGNPHVLKDLDTVGDRAGTLLDAAETIYKYLGAVLIIVRVAEEATENEQMTAVIGSAVERTGLYAFLDAENIVGYAPRILIAPGFTSTRPTGVMTVPVTAGGTGYTAGTIAFTGGLAANGVAATAIPVIAGGVITGIQVTSAGYGYTSAPTAALTGVGGTGATLGTVTIGAAANPVVTNLAAVARQLRAVCFVDGPNTTFAAALAYRNDFDDDRIFITDPYVMDWDVTTSTYAARPASPHIAGLQAWLDTNYGFWYSPSNYPLYTGGVARSIGFGIANSNSEATLMNESRINTVIRKTGIRAWGNRSTTLDAVWSFISVRRTADMIYESVEQAYLYYVDKPFSKQLLVSIANSGKSYLRTLRAEGAVLGGDVWLDPALNEPTEMMQGKLTMSFSFEPPAPAEHIRFKAYRDPSQYANLINEAVREIGGPGLDQVNV